MSSGRLTTQIIDKLRRFSLIKTAQIPIKSVEETIQFAQAIKEVDTNGVKPMICGSESIDLYLHDDVPKGTPRLDITSNSKYILEDYFVTPPGNVPLKIGTELDKKKGHKIGAKIKSKAGKESSP